MAKPISLSIILPLLANLDLTVDNENQHKLTMGNDDYVWISDFSIAYRNKDIDISSINDLFIDAFLNIYDEQAENDGFNKLVLGCITVMAGNYYTSRLFQIFVTNWLSL